MYRVVLLIVFASCIASAQSFLAELKAEPNMARRAEKALLLANSAFDSAHDSYDKGHIREGDAHMLFSEMQTGRKHNMQTMDNSLLNLYQRGEITYDVCLSHAREPESIRNRTERAAR